MKIDNSPRLQNVPVRTGLGSEIRGAFILHTWHRIVGSDYNKVEQRLLEYYMRSKNATK